MATESVVSAFRVLEAVAEAQPVGLSELARSVGLPKSTVQRNLLTLQEVGWLRPTETAPTRWQLTYRVVAIVGRAGGESLREAALPVMNELQLGTTETIHLAAADGDSLVLVERLDTPHRLRAFLPLGERIALHASATGLAYLSACGDEYLDKYLAGPLPAQTPDTLTDPGRIRAVVNEIRERGYSVNVGGLSHGISSLGAPIESASGPVAAVSVSGPSSRITADRFDELGPQVREAAARISLALRGER
ncbi:IclR family transcriptional regulator [Mycolicibacterium diernhoferi]|uniref:IclR family transcriptional regulator n=1 Tax=Mycolicibacterium diernhoferi TaxID=1801 RepID=A0A1Q4HL67_9MYCO|nr:IclR family transcriptional regulator [Mycolicibacterium diernhoferi]OJZ68192.1 IclR family transcriptional regulator [Mycolicibacterium diernhoferi]OPE55742.1 IclR family transcriptional regulator [Mycolicibacterium diernhoferi]PEG56248.1 IclR family transcriptional regulator [Mycolicibacterium diernhoferi]QYL21320.1 IclR family transcriptional regulator [Mycolicibacterium diernhoferi]